MNSCFPSLLFMIQDFHNQKSIIEEMMKIITSHLFQITKSRKKLYTHTHIYNINYIE